MIDSTNQTIRLESWGIQPVEALRPFSSDELAQTSYRSTLVIALGGTGYRVARALKTHIQEHFAGDEREVFQFAVFDTTREEVPEGEQPLDPGEFVYLGTFDAAGIIRHLADNPYIASWWPGGTERPYRVDFSGTGAHRVRAVGRLVLFHHISHIVATLRRKIDRAISVNAQHGIGAESLKIYIVCSLAGGTGSGMVLDMAYLARMLGRERHLTPYVTGVLVTDDPFLPQVDTTNTLAEFSANAYAALREINHFSATRTFHQRYNKLISTEKLHPGTYRPFDVAYLLGMHNRSQALESFDSLTRMIAAEMMMEIASPMDDVTSNLLDNLRGPRRSIAGQPTAFSSFALSSLVYPLDGVSGWCALRALAPFSAQVLLQPSVEATQVIPDTASFLQKARVEENQGDQLLEQLNLHDTEQPMAIPTLSQSQVESLSEAQLSGMMQHLEETKLSEAAAVRTRIAANVQSIEKAFNSVLEETVESMLRDPQRGPRYVTWFLSSVENELASQRDTDIMGEQAMYSDEVQKQEKAWQRAKTEMSKALLLPGWMPGRSGRISRARDRRVAAFNAYVSATIEHEMRSQAIQCQNSFVEDVAGLGRRANDLVREWEKMAQTAAERAAGEITQEQATRTRFSLVRSIVTMAELERTFERHLPVMDKQEQRRNLASRFWQYMERQAPGWKLAGKEPVLMGEANPAWQAYYFLAEEYARALGATPLLQRLRDLYGAAWEREIETRYALTEPFWRYVEARFASQINDNLEHEPRLVGYGEEENTGWADHVSHIVGGAIKGVNTRNPHQMVFLRTAHGLPLFAMPDVTERMREAYDVLCEDWEQEEWSGDAIPVHISDAWELRDITPTAVQPPEPEGGDEVPAANNGAGRAIVADQGA